MNTIHKIFSLPGKRQLHVAQGDLTGETVDAIVNAANYHLKHGGGIAAAIVRNGGGIIQQESDDWVRLHGPVTNTQPAYTSAGNLPSKYVIHAVGPIWGEGDEDRKLSDAIIGSLRCAGELSLSSIAFPAISTGIFGFPKDRAARIFFKTIPEFFINEPESCLQLVKIVLWSQEDLDIFLKAANAILWTGPS